MSAVQDPQARDESSRRAQARYASYLAFNFGASIATIFLGKLVMSGLQFKFSCLLTAMHYMVTTAGLELLRLGGAYEHRASPMTPRLLMLVLLVGSAPAVNNLSLRYNNLGFYQVNKLLVTPCIVTLEWVCFGITVSRPRLAALLAIAAGVGVASVNDVSITMAGCLASCATLPLNAAYKALWSREQKQNGWTTLALMRRVLPLSTVALLAMSPLIDPPGVSEFEWTPRSTGLIFLSCLSAFLVNWSGFLVIGACSALTHQVLGQLKASVVVLGGWCIFDQVYPAKSLLGAALAASSIVAYTSINLREQEQQKLLAKQRDPSP